MTISNLASASARALRPRTGVLSRSVAGLCLASTIAMASVSFGQTNVDPDVLPSPGYHNISPVTKVLPKVLWSLGGVLLLIAGGVILLRVRADRTLYQAGADARWETDAQEEAGQVDQNEAIEDLLNPEEPAPETEDAVVDTHSRLYTPATGPAWNEGMLNAFLSACLKANCLGRAWREEAARRQQGQAASRRLTDPREAEFVRKMKARWQEFHVEPEFGIFITRRADGAESEERRVCLIEVTREKHAITRAALNAGFLIESLGRYLRSSDMVYPAEPGYYHAPSLEELNALSEEEKKGLLRLKHIPDPWQAMIAGWSSDRTSACQS